MAVALGISLVGATALYVLINPELIYGTANIQVLEVTLGSMCVPYDGACPGRLSPDESTIHIGDYIVFEPVDPKDLNTDYPNSDIIVFHQPGDQTSNILLVKKLL